MTVYLVYWTPENISLCERTSGWSMSCWGSKLENFSTHWKKGDVAYFINIDSEGHSSIFGKLTLEQFANSREEAEEIIGRPLTAAPFNQYWIGEKPWLKLHDVDCRDLLMNLTFKSGNKLKEGFDGRSFQAPRPLTEEDAQAVEARWLAFTE